MPFGVVDQVGPGMCCVGGGADCPTGRGNFVDQYGVVYWKQ